MSSARALPAFLLACVSGGADDHDGAFVAADVWRAQSVDSEAVVARKQLAVFAAKTEGGHTQRHGCSKHSPAKHTGTKSSGQVARKKSPRGPIWWCYNVLRVRPLCRGLKSARSSTCPDPPRPPQAAESPAARPHPTTRPTALPRHHLLQQLLPAQAPRQRVHQPRHPRPVRRHQPLGRPQHRRSRAPPPSNPILLLVLPLLHHQLRGPCRHLAHNSQGPRQALVQPHQVRVAAQVVVPTTKELVAVVELPLVQPRLVARRRRRAVRAPGARLVRLVARRRPQPALPRRCCRCRCCCRCCGVMVGAAGRLAGGALQREAAAPRRGALWLCCAVLLLLLPLLRFVTLSATDGHGGVAGGLGACGAEGRAAVRLGRG